LPDGNFFDLSPVWELHSCLNQYYNKYDSRVFNRDISTTISIYIYNTLINM